LGSITAIAFFTGSENELGAAAVRVTMLTHGHPAWL
jgi:hypothetical protein